MEIIQPPHWPRPRGYSYGVVAQGRLVFLAGVVGWDREGRFRHKDFVGQARQALENIVELLREAGAHPRHLVRLTWYVVDREEYLQSLAELGVVYREVVGPFYPPMSVVQVVALVEAEARLEIEATAVVPDGEP
ncbi:MAG: RidA family protein [Thermus sp.]|uniref:RidA family protein n=1 Tax=Thermus sp. TaxID=275 RepID=UPI0025EFEC76|nr:RidA family protein [Thermus sp.]MCS6867746.1 RidA family protein [Thermus sp.]MCS7219265.1 RidA family protein [Thermus sp.]MDW8018228.1 RidA family protein [Thermus sp.]MDW8357923.1 RidA family protein [Thermus sp.]